MNTALFITAVVLVSLVLWLAAIVLRQARTDRARAMARVDALRRAAAGHESASPVMVDLPLAAEPEMMGTPAALGALPMFAAVDEPPPPRRRWISLAMVGVLMVAVLGTAFALGTSDPPPVSTSGPAPSTPSPSAVRAPEPLALISLQHSLDRSGQLTVTGAIRNPATAETIDALVSVVTVFDRQGVPVQTRESAIAAVPLGPDRLASFATTIPGVRGISRFTIAFRAADGRAIPHVDRRATLTGALR